MADIENKKQSLIQLAAASAGSIVESFDWLIYAFLAPYFSSAIFPGDDPVASLFATYLVFAVGFLVRPLGAIIMGRLVDRRGRRYGLIVSVCMISFGSLLIALTPGYDHIGICAALIVMLARFVQGVAMSGEQAAATTYILETAPPQRRYLYGAVSNAATYIGQMLATLCLAALVNVLGHEGLVAGGWRVGFLIAAALGVIALWLRKAAPESEIFAAQVESESFPQMPLLVAHKRQIISVFLLVIPSTMGLYFITAFMAMYLESSGVAAKEHVSGYVPFFIFYLILIIVLSGWLADRIGGLRVVRFAHAMLVLTTVPIIYGMYVGAIHIVPGALIYLALLGAATGPFAMIGPQLFPPAIRAVGMGVPAMVAVAVFGGTFPLLAQTLTINGYGQLLPYYLGLGSVAALVGSWIIHSKDMSAQPHSLKKSCMTTPGSSTQLPI